MIPLQFYNSMTRQQEPFEALDKTVRFYTCGPTVYNFAHIGNFRAYVFEDVLRRTLKLAGHGVCQVMNLTDVDDKTIRGAREKGVALNDYTAPYKQAFFDDLKILNIESAEIYPAATDHVPEMIALIEKLMAKGLAYKSDDGSVYFKVAAFPGYGKLAHLDPSTLRSGVRINNDEYEKEGVGDFALWKAWDEADGDVVWDSPFGRGRPGWHLECSAMGMKYLGETFDLHTGGIDNLFPHHENEIAQAEGATGKPFVKTWMHCAHLRVNGEKMSKSLGNFFTLRDLLAKGYTGREIRYVLLQGHYRQPLNFTLAGLDAARTAFERIDGFVARLQACHEATPAVPEWAEKHRAQFRAAMADDLNLPEAFAALFGLIREGNAALDKNEPAAGALDVLHEMDHVFGVIFTAKTEEEIPAEVQTLLDQRAAARAEKRWADSDTLRDAIRSLGWEVRDGKAGQTVKKV